jgi:glycosyltransferase involved in cell wall biosynthesis
MRILFVAHGYPPEAAGGTELHTRATARALAARGHEVSVFAASRSLPVGEIRDRRENDVAVRLLGAEAGADYPMRLHDERARAEFERLLDEREADVVHIQHLLFLSADLVEAAKERGLPVVVSLHDFWFQCPLIHPARRTRHRFRGALWGLACFFHYQRPSLVDLASLAARRELRPLVARHLARARFLRRQLERADLVLAPSQYLRDRFVRFGVAPEKLYVLPHAVEHAPLDERLPAGDTVRFGFVGSVRPEKGVHVLAEAFVQVPDGASLTIHGPCDDEAYVASLIGPRVRFAGPFEHDRAREVFAGFDVLVAPSLVEESFSLVALEAQSFGRPVIASRIGALAEVVDDGRNGVLVPPGDVEALAQALRRLGDPEEARRMAEATRVPLAPARHIERLEALYTGVRGRAAPVASTRRRGG